MHYSQKVRPRAYAIPTSFVPRVETAVVRDEEPGGPPFPSADLYARRLAREAEAWLRLVEERTRMRPDALVRKTLDALAFSMRHRARSLAVPLWLSLDS